MSDIDPDKIIDLGKTHDEEFGLNEPENDKVFYPHLRLDAGIIPGDIGSDMFLKVLVKKTSIDIAENGGNEGFEIRNMRIIGHADGNTDHNSDHGSDHNSGDDFDKAVEIVIEKKIKIQPEEK